MVTAGQSVGRLAAAGRCVVATTRAAPAGAGTFATQSRGCGDVGQPTW